MPTVLVTTDYLEPGDEVDQLLQAAGCVTVHLPMKGARDEAELAAALLGVDGALVANEPMSAAVLEHAESLRAVVRTGVGYDSIDIEAAARLGITVSNLPGINAVAVAEYTMGMLLGAARRLGQNAIAVSEGRWPRQNGNEIRGATLGLIGYGAAGQAVAPLAQAFGMSVVVTTAYPPVLPSSRGLRFVELDELLEVSDFVSVHRSLTASSRGLLGAREFDKMKANAILINTARGPLVDEAALVDAVQSGSIAGAALDVVCDEPLSPSSPLRDVPDIVVYPHMAGQAAEPRLAAGVEGAKELLAAMKGSAQFSVNSPDFLRATSAVQA